MQTADKHDGRAVAQSMLDKMLLFLAAGLTQRPHGMSDWQEKGNKKLPMQDPSRGCIWLPLIPPLGEDTML
jgi:hypothetical protein